MQWWLLFLGDPDSMSQVAHLDVFMGSSVLHHLAVLHIQIYVYVLLQRTGFLWSSCYNWGFYVYELSKVLFLETAIFIRAYTSAFRLELNFTWWCHLLLNTVALSKLPILSRSFRKYSDVKHVIRGQFSYTIRNLYRWTC